MYNLFSGRKHKTNIRKILKYNTFEQDNNAVIEDDISKETRKYILDKINLINYYKPTLNKKLYTLLFTQTSSRKYENKDIHNNYAKYFISYEKKKLYDNIKRLLSISLAEEKMLNKFIKPDGSMPKYYNQEYDIKTNYDVSKKENLIFMTSMPRLELIKDMLDTYHTDDSMLRQFSVDFPRLGVYINKIKHTNIDMFFAEISKYNRDFQINLEKRKNISLFMLCVTLVCQSAYYLQYMHIFNKVAYMKEVYKNNPFDSRHILHVADYKKQNIIELYISDSFFKCSLVATHSIMNIDTVKPLYNYQSETLIDMNNDLCLIVYDIF